ncbi:unnamed protein product, partial [Nesidiocoris tenuis]
MSGLSDVKREDSIMPIVLDGMKGEPRNKKRLNNLRLDGYWKKNYTMDSISLRRRSILRNHNLKIQKKILILVKSGRMIRAKVEKITHDGDSASVLFRAGIRLYYHAGRVISIFCENLSSRVFRNTFLCSTSSRYFKLSRITWKNFSVAQTGARWSSCNSSMDQARPVSPRYWLPGVPPSAPLGPSVSTTRTVARFVFSLRLDLIVFANLNLRLARCRVLPVAVVSLEGPNWLLRLTVDAMLRGQEETLPTVRFFTLYGNVATLRNVPA